MPLLDWLRRRSPSPPPDDPLDDALQRANKATVEALDAVNESRERRGAPLVSWEDMLALDGPARAIRDARRRIEEGC